ncbi:MAG TPA: tRNA 2-thiouridine(34) synthase MnmA [Candidatus Baltobacteraceae bacterium]|jgi:tRNA-specific 2-thiouridylase|nr:tRNA 2-thiouridine(34) synthase MnmA [Candidatus Baltobacteraceae bacterium]
MSLKKLRLVAAMSGGVDSAVAAGLLVEAGYDVIGVTMRTYAPTRPHHAKSCCGAEDFDDARTSATILGIPHYVLDVEEAFERAVIERFVTAYQKGRTPNPCVDCNVFIKLGTLSSYARKIGAQSVATGHYARLEQLDDGPHLFAGDAQKDQSYALAALTPTQLSSLVLPLGDFDKTHTRAEALRMGLPVSEKAESQDICFLEGRDYRELLADGDAPGEFRTSDARSLGTHEGIAHYTVGQRRGLPANNENDGPRYVTRIDPHTNTVTIGREDELFSRGLIAENVNVIRPERLQGPVRVRAMTRYRSPLNIAVARIEGKTLTLDFATPERAVAPGQLVALYDERTDEVLAAATIREGM